MQSRSDKDIYSSIKLLLDEYDAWKDVKIIILDTTAVNTGHKIGVVVRFKKRLSKKVWKNRNILDASTIFLMLF